jgi:hypothetical protein
VQALKRDCPWLESTLAALLVTRLDDVKWYDDMYEEFVYTLPLRWYLWAVSFVLQHRQFYPPSHTTTSVERLVDLAERLESKLAEEA